MCVCAVRGMVLNLPVAAWIGIALGSLAFIVFIILCGCFCVCVYRRHRMKVQMKRAFEVRKRTTFGGMHECVHACVCVCVWRGRGGGGGQIRLEELRITLLNS